MSLATTRQRVLYEAREIWRKGFITFDTETTGLEWEDQIIQWAVCDQEGTVLGSGFVKPTVRISEGAYLIHGISEAQIHDAPTFAEAWPIIRDLLTERIVVIYNDVFDKGMLWSSAAPYGIKIPYGAIQSICAMHLFARFYGEIHDYYGTYTWKPLNECAIPHLKIEIPGRAHDAEHDAAATAMIIRKLAELADQELLPGWHPPVNVACAGCGKMFRECAEEDEIWYCQQCALAKGMFHHCPGCPRVVESPASGFICEDLCQYCHQRLYQEMMLLTGAWHWCPDHWYSLVVETPDLDELCADCKRQREWRRKEEERERARQAQLLQERKERRRAYAKEYRKARKEREQENRRRAEQGQPLLEQRKARPPEEIINHHGHQFQRRKDEHGRYEVYCLKCDAVWSKPPRCYCAGIKTYRSWGAIPEHLKTRTQLLKLKLKPAKGQKATAVIDGSFDRYRLYDQQQCVVTSKKKRN